jgi:hypothetical protein
MRLRYLHLAMLMGCCVAMAPALAVFVFRVGDTVYVDGKRYSWEEWKKIRDDPDLPKPSQPAASSAGGPRAAACTTAIYYDEFPSEDERFQCTAGLGALTREQILEKGWKVDFVEKIPPPSDQPAQSPRGLPLYLYKLVISRYGGYRSESPQQRTPSSTSRSIDTQCMNDCLGSSATKEFCEDRCTY